MLKRMGIVLALVFGFSGTVACGDDDCGNKSPGDSCSSDCSCGNDLFCADGECTYTPPS